MRRWAALAGILCLVASPAAAQRIFYPSRLWLDTSAAVQRLSLLGVLEAWRAQAEREGALPLSHRQREVVRLHECLLAEGHRVDDLVAQLTRFGREAERTFYSLGDFVSEGLRPLCAGRPGAEPSGPRR